MNLASMVFGIPLLFVFTVVGLIVLAVTGLARGNRSAPPPRLTDEEMRLIREMDRKLEAFADRIEALETILIEERRFAPMPPVIASRPPVLA